MNAIPRFALHSEGAALFSYGFRPFFLFGATYAAFVVLIWLPVFYGELTLPSSFSPRDWHVHELLYGYLPAVITGFLLTAIPNWTGRLPLQGKPLILLVLVWAAGRFATTLSSMYDELIVAAIDVSFLFLVAAATAREIIAGNNWRNLKVLIPVTVLGAGNILFHVEVYTRGSADVSIRIGIAAVLILVMIIGGRVIPSFTRNWLARENPGRLPAPFDRFDVVAIALSVVALSMWAALPENKFTALALLAAAILHLIRMARWAGDRTLRDRLVLVLHVAYAFLPLGFLLTGLASFAVFPPSAGLHAWMVGAVGTMTLAVMTRASLGHTGHPLKAPVGTQAIYAAVVISALARVCAVLMPEWSDPLLHIAGLGWVVAFGGFVALYGPMLLRPRRVASVT